MTLEQYCEKYLTDHGVWPEDVGKILPAVKDHPAVANLADRWGKEENTQPVLDAVRIVVDDVTYKWLCEHQPGHWAKGVFDPLSRGKLASETTTPAKGFDWKKFDALNPNAGGVKVGGGATLALNLVRRAGRGYAIPYAIPYINVDGFPTPEQIRDMARRLGLGVDEIHDTITLVIDADKVDAVKAEIAHFQRINREAAGAAKDVTERPDRFEQT